MGPAKTSIKQIKTSGETWSYLNDLVYTVINSNKEQPFIIAAGYR